jgi:hypothetical protein
MALTIEEVAADCNKSEYPFYPTARKQEAWKDAGIVVVFGASDDLMELQGAVDEEVGCYGGGEALLHRGGLLDVDAVDALHGSVGLAEILPKCARIEALWSDGGPPSWKYKTAIPHATFQIVEDGDVYCIGLVFYLKDLPEVPELAEG